MSAELLYASLKDDKEKELNQQQTNKKNKIEIDLWF